MIYLSAKARKIKDVLFPIVFGISIGYLLGLILFYDSGNSKDIFENVHIVDHHKSNSNRISFSLRCVIIIHPSASKPDKILSALDDGYTKHCNETIYFSNDEKLVKKLEAKYPIRYLDLYGNHFYWSFYQNVMESSSKNTPSQWTFIGDDQTYLMVPNLQKTLQSFNSNEKVVMGKVKNSNSFLSWIFPFSISQTVSVRGGVVFSNPAIDQLAMCRGFFFPRSSDLSLFECSRDYGVRVVDPFDEDSLRLFNDMPPMKVITPDTSKSWFRQNVVNNGKCSDHAITFGQMSMKEMRVVEFGTKLKVFGKGGIDNTDESTNTTIV